MTEETIIKVPEIKYDIPEVGVEVWVAIKGMDGTDTGLEARMQYVSSDVMDSWSKVAKKAELAEIKALVALRKELSKEEAPELYPDAQGRVRFNTEVAAASEKEHARMIVRDVVTGMRGAAHGGVDLSQISRAELVPRLERAHLLPIVAAAAMRFQSPTAHQVF
ncbi:MAG: hypothetical protein E6Q97_35695 [Desulfurellales bacterium]|nr:MAG: hypothetical protein E6Q97_35695 [Desulfurellales bacterium]